MTTSSSTMMIRNCTVPPQAVGRASRASASAPEGRERAPLDRRPRARGQVEYEAQIMQAEQPQAEHLLLVDEVADVRAREARARRAVAALLERPRIAGEAGVAQVEPSLAR